MKIDYYYNMAIPDEIVEEIGLKKPTALKKTVKLIYDAKHTKQYTLRIPAGFIEKVNWEGGDMIGIEIENGSLKLRKE
jgi:antitoxin component of MazEF toxin-antitoxin module